jgi:hypothetical protein
MVFGKISIARGTWDANSQDFSGGFGGEREYGAKVSNFLMKSSFQALPASRFRVIFDSQPKIECPKP